jgi:hypothetical protein
MDLEVEDDVPGFLANLDGSYYQKSDPSCAKSIALSTLDNEYTSLSEAMTYVLPLQTLIEVVANAVGIDPAFLTTFRTTAKFREIRRLLCGW